MFRSEKFVQLVFADPEDSYCLESGMQMNLDAFLWFQLSRAGFHGIYFITGTADDCRVEVLDAPSFDQFQNREKKGLLKKLFGAPEKTFDRSCRSCRMGEEEYASFRNWIPGQLRREEQAFVFRLDTFCSMADGPGGEELLRQLVELQNRQIRSKILLCAPKEVGKTIQLLNSTVFSHAFGRDHLCNDVYKTLHEAERIPLFDGLKQRMGDAAVFLNDYAQDRITALMNAVQNAPGTQFLSEELRAAMAEYLDCWAHSYSIRKRDTVLDTGGAMLSYRDMIQRLQQSKNWKQLARRAKQFREYGGKASVEDYRDSSVCTEMQTHTDLSRRAEKIVIPEENGQAARDYQEVCRLLRTPWNRLPAEQMKQYAGGWLLQLEKACQCHDPNEENILVQALLFACRHLWLEPEGNAHIEEAQKICDLYDKLLKLYRQQQVITERLNSMPREEMDTETEIRFNKLLNEWKMIENAIQFEKGQLNELEDNFGRNAMETRRIIEQMEQKNTEMLYQAQTVQEETASEWTEADENYARDLLQNFY